MGCEEEERLLFPSFVFPESFAEAATPGSGDSECFICISSLVPVPYVYIYRVIHG
jgi:hypothetical protein